MFNDPVFLALVVSYVLCMVLLAVVGGLVGIVRNLQRQNKKR